MEQGEKWERVRAEERERERKGERESQEEMREELAAKNQPIDLLSHCSLDLLGLTLSAVYCSPAESLSAHSSTLITALQLPFAPSGLLFLSHPASEFLPRLSIINCTYR